MTDNILKELCQIILDNKGTDVIYLNCSSVNPLAEYYVICTANSTRQALALGKYCDQVLAKNGINVNHIEGNDSSEWVLVDGIDYIVHIFVKDARNRYGLEKMWSELEMFKVEDKDESIINCCDGI